MTLACLLHPMLSRLTPEERRSALVDARRTPLDIIELVAIAAALIVGIVLVRGGIDSIGAASAGRDASDARSLAAGAAFCAAFIGLVLVRRTRRGLRRSLEAARTP